MSMVGTFDGFTAARLGIYAAQHGLNVTGNNVSNINTPGYTRQRPDQVSFKVGANDLYRSFYDNHVGGGALVTSISQLRDPYLDIRFRNASTDTYHYDTWLSGLQNIASILDEVGKGENADGLIYKQIQDLAEKLRAYSANPTDLNDRLVRNSAESLTDLFHYAATRLERLYNETRNEFNENIDTVNEILTSIRDLNKTIREAEVHGDAALEMRDERNRQIDKLSQYLDIKVEYSFENIGGGLQVEKLTIRLNNANPDPSVKTDESILVDGLFATQLSVPDTKVALNIYSKDYPYLGDSKYLKMISADEAQAFVDALNAGKDADADDLITLDDLLQAWDENGKPLLDDNKQPVYLIGADDPDVDGIFRVKNDNYTIQLAQLKNVKDELWKSSTTSCVEVKASDVMADAIFAYNVNANLENGSSFKIGDKTYNVAIDEATGKITITEEGTDTNVSTSILNDAGDAVDPAKFAKFVAERLNPDDYEGYTISSNADGQVVFTVKDPDNPPEKMPHLAAKDPDNTNWITVGNMETLPVKEYDQHGNVTKSTQYTNYQGQWYKIVVSTEHTHEVTLDDNDLRGILQAEREMLTEEGEFSSADDVAIDESALIKRGIPYYQKSLDLLAQKFAQAYNQLNQGYAYNQDGNYIDENGKELLLYDLNAENEDGSVGGLRPISATDGLTEGQRENLLNNGLFVTNDLGQPIDENGNLILNEDGEPLGYFLSGEITNDDGTVSTVAVDKDGNQIFDEDGQPIPVTTVAELQPEDSSKLLVDMDKLMEPGVTSVNPDEPEPSLGGVKMGGVMFTQLDGETTTGINASNISIAGGWSNGVYGLIPTFMMLFKDGEGGGLTHSTQNDNADHMVAMIENALTYNPRDLYGSDAIGPELFNGSFNDMLSNMMAKEGEDASITGTRLTTAVGTLNELDYSREGVSGVDLNDEAMNMITYQKAMTAAMRVMTTIDQMLDRLINGTAV